MCRIPIARITLDYSEIFIQRLYPLLAHSKNLVRLNLPSHIERQGHFKWSGVIHFRLVGKKGIRQAYYKGKWCCSFLWAKQQCPGWQRLWHFKYYAKWLNTKYASHHDWEELDDCSGNLSQCEDHLCAYACRMCIREDVDMPHALIGTLQNAFSL